MKRDPFQFRKDRGYYYVSWVHKGKTYKIYKYNGEFLYHQKLAEKLLACRQIRKKGYSELKNTQKKFPRT